MYVFFLYIAQMVPSNQRNHIILFFGAILPRHGYRVFPGGKMRPGRAADHSPPSTAAVMEG